VFKYDLLCLEEIRR